MADDKHLTEEEILPEHLDDPKGTGCIWRIPYFTKEKKRSGEAQRHPHSGLATAPSYCCNHAHNSYTECKKTARSKYHATEYLQRLDKISVDYRRYHAKKEATAEKAEKILVGATKNEKLRAWAANFTREGWWDKYYQAAWGDPRYRLRTEPKGQGPSGTDRDHSLAWKVGHEVDGRLRRDERYLGVKGKHLLWTANRDPPGKMPPNHADGSVDGALGSWYPYPHNHHHIITIGEIKALMSEPKPSEDSDATPQLRKYVMVSSKWNINGEKNMLILATDVTVAKVIELPAHTPWGARSHKKYSNDVKTKLTPVLKKLDQACDSKKDDEHKVAAEKAESIKKDLEDISEYLRTKIESGAYGRQL